MMTWSSSDDEDYVPSSSDGSSGDDTFTQKTDGKPKERGQTNYMPGPPHLSEMYSRTQIRTDVVKDTRLESKRRRKDGPRKEVTREEFRLLNRTYESIDDGSIQRRVNDEERKLKIAMSWGDLPAAVMHIIFDYCCKEKEGNLCGYLISCVCRGWRDAVLSSQSIWHHVDCSSKSQNVTNSIIKYESSRWKHKIESLSLSGCNSVSDEGLLAVAASCSRLHSLDISYCTKFTADALCKALDTMFRRSGSSERALKSLDLSGIKLPGHKLDAVLQSALISQSQNLHGPVLRQLRAKNCDGISLGPLNFVVQESLQNHFPLLSSLQVLQFSGSTFETKFDLHIRIAPLQFVAPNLEVFDFNDVFHTFGWKIDPGLSNYERKYLSAFEKSSKMTRAPEVGWKNLRSFKIGQHVFSEEITRSDQQGCYICPGALEQALSSTRVLEEIDISGINKLGSRAPSNEFINSECSLKRVIIRGNGLLGRFLFRQILHLNAEVEMSDDSVNLKLVETLEHLNVAKNLDILSPNAINILSQCTKLNFLDISFSNTTTEEIKLLLTGLHAHGNDANIQINLEGCRSVDRNLRRIARFGSWTQIYKNFIRHKE